MALTYGFYNSLNGDRKYNAKQFGSIFDGVIHDGVYINIGQRFYVEASGNGFQVNVNTGRAWFNHTWTLNDTVYPVVLPSPEVLLNKWVAVVLEVNEGLNYRQNSIKTVAGIPSNNPQYPELVNNASVHQYPLSYCLVRANTSAITQADIVNMVGTSACPYVTSVAASMNIDELISRWESQWAQWFSNTNAVWDSNAAAKNKAFNDFMDSAVTQYGVFITGAQSEYNSFMASSRSGFDTFLNTKNNEFNYQMEWMRDDFGSFWDEFKEGMQEYLQAQETIWENWFQHIQGQLTEDAATNLQRQIDSLAYAYVIGHRAVLGITACVAHEKVIFGTWGSLQGNKVVVGAPTLPSN